MKFLLFVLCVLIISNTSLIAKDYIVKVNNPPIPYDGSPEWQNDFLVSATEPLGRPSGVYRNSNTTIYVSVPDTNIQSGSAIAILTSANDGANWSIISTLTPASVITKTKMIRSSSDSVYCYFLSGVTVYCWNVINNRVTQVRGVGFRDFDVASSSTGSMYIFMDSLGTNNIVRYGSSDGGVTWGARGLVTSGGAHPRIYMSALGDTLVLNYYGPVLADTATSIIRNARYRESAPGTMATAGSFTNVAVANNKKEQFASVMYGRYVWFIYSSETGGDVDIKCKVSTNSTVSFTDSANIGLIPENDDFWFDAKHHFRGSGGMDIIFYSVPGKASTSTGGSGSLKYSTLSTIDPITVTYNTSISSHPPVSSATGYIPTLIEYYNVSKDAGAIWVGDDAGSNRLYFDRLLAVSNLDLTVNLEACSPMQDTITVLLRSAASPYDIVDNTKVYLSGTGTASVSYTNALNNVNYYIVCNHRNSIDTWSKSGGEIFVNGQLSYNFTTAASQAYGNNMVLVSGKYSFYTGDANKDGIVDGGDGALIDNDASSFVSGYVVTDLNCDTIVDGTDASYAENNAVNFVSVISP